MTSRMMNVTLDGGESFPALVDPAERWNGWLCPRFDRATAERIAADFAKQRAEFGAEMVPFVITFDGDTVVVADTQYADEIAAGFWGDPDEVYRPERINPDRDGLYDVGSYSWCWYEDDRDTPFVCEWCCGDGCKSCGFTGHKLDPETGEPVR